MEKINNIIIFTSIIFVSIFLLAFSYENHKLSSRTSTTLLMNNVQNEKISLIKLNGDTTITLYLNEDYIDPGYEVLDDSVDVKIEGNVDTDKLGIYYVSYTAIDKNKNKEIVKREVKVIKRKIDGKEKYIYLTFDDGPSYSITHKLLDILKEEDVKATFFIINHNDDLNYLIKRQYDEGHAIGIHSYSHVYKVIYNSLEDYFKDFNLIQNKIYNITGYKSNIVRFPGGTSNTISRNYSKGIMTKLTKELENRNLYYFDWNISSGDATGRISKNRVYKNVINNLRYTHNVILMHDFENNYSTLNAIKDIIKYGKENGFTFKTLSSNGPIVHHKAQN